MAYTETHKAALQEAIASGVLRVSYDGKTVEYRNMAELREALAEVNRGLAATAGNTIRRTVKIYADKGL
jgi:hypothetical protein